MAKRRKKSRKVGGRMKCPAKYKGHKVRKIKGGACAIRKKNGQMRFVKKVRAARRKRR